MKIGEKSAASARRFVADRLCELKSRYLARISTGQMLKKVYAGVKMLSFCVHTRCKACRASWRCAFLSAHRCTKGATRRRQASNRDAQQTRKVVALLRSKERRLSLRLRRADAL